MHQTRWFNLDVDFFLSHRHLRCCCSCLPLQQQLLLLPLHPLQLQQQFFHPPNPPFVVADNDRGNVYTGGCIQQFFVAGIKPVVLLYFPKKVNNISISGLFKQDGNMVITVENTTIQLLTSSSDDTGVRWVVGICRRVLLLFGRRREKVLLKQGWNKG